MLLPRTFPIVCFIVETCLNLFNSAIIFRAMNVDKSSLFQVIPSSYTCYHRKKIRLFSISFILFFTSLICCSINLETLLTSSPFVASNYLLILKYVCISNPSRVGSKCKVSNNIIWHQGHHEGCWQYQCEGGEGGVLVKDQVSIQEKNQRGCYRVADRNKQDYKIFHGVKSYKTNTFCFILGGGPWFRSYLLKLSCLWLLGDYWAGFDRSTLQ